MNSQNGNAVHHSHHKNHTIPFYSESAVITLDFPVPPMPARYILSCSELDSSEWWAINLKTLSCSLFSEKSLIVKVINVWSDFNLAIKFFCK